MTSSDGPTASSAAKTWPWLAYNAALGAALPVWGPYAAWRLTRGKGAGRAERLGYGKALPPSEGRIWIHGASVGEMVAVKPIVEAFRTRHAETPMAFSTITPTGREQAEKSFPWAEDIRYVPLDAPGPVARALKAVKPRVVALVETELWPNFVHGAAARACVVLVNGRLSDRSLATAMRAKPLYRWMLSHFHAIGVQTAADAERFVSVGAPEDRIQVLGTAKFDESVPLLTEDEKRRWRQEIGLGDAPALIAGSTFPGEDEAVLGAYAECRKIVPGLRLIIAPRHIDRSGDLVLLVQKAGMTAVRRTEGGSADVLVLDTFGELAAMYGLAEAAFIGKSLGERGGQNLIQPMAHGVPVVYGPNMQNFRDVAAQAEAAGASVSVQDAAGLADAWAGLLVNPERARGMGAAGRTLVERNRGAAQRYADLLAEAL